MQALLARVRFACPSACLGIGLLARTAVIATCPSACPGFWSCRRALLCGAGATPVDTLRCLKGCSAHFRLTLGDKVFLWPWGATPREHRSGICRVGLRLARFFRWAARCREVPRGISSRGEALATDLSVLELQFVG